MSPGDRRHHLSIILWITLQFVFASISLNHQAMALFNPYVSEFEYSPEFHPSRNPSCPRRRARSAWNGPRSPEEGMPVGQEPSIEIRAVLVRCPKSHEEMTEVPMNGNTYNISAGRSRDILEFHGFDRDEPSHHSEVRNCRRKLVVTMKFNNVGKTRTQEEFVVVDHVLDPVTMHKARLLNPFVFKVRQEQVLQLYGLKFQSVVNGEAREEVINKNWSNYTGCDDSLVNPTCGQMMFDGQPVPYSQGFCCSCDPDVNAARQPNVRSNSSLLGMSQKIISGPNEKQNPGHENVASNGMFAHLFASPQSPNENLRKDNQFKQARKVATDSNDQNHIKGSENQGAALSKRERSLKASQLQQIGPEIINKDFFKRKKQIRGNYRPFERQYSGVRNYERENSVDKNQDSIHFRNGYFGVEDYSAARISPALREAFKVNNPSRGKIEPYIHAVKDEALGENEYRYHTPSIRFAGNGKKNIDGDSSRDSKEVKHRKLRNYKSLKKKNRSSLSRLENKDLTAELVGLERKYETLKNSRENISNGSAKRMSNNDGNSRNYSKCKDFRKLARDRAKYLESFHTEDNSSNLSLSNILPMGYDIKVIEDHEPKPLQIEAKSNPNAIRTGDGRERQSITFNLKSNTANEQKRDQLTPEETLLKFEIAKKLKSAMLDVQKNNSIQDYTHVDSALNSFANESAISTSVSFTSSQELPLTTTPPVVQSDSTLKSTISTATTWINNTKSTTTIVSTSYPSLILRQKIANDELYTSGYTTMNELSTMSNAKVIFSKHFKTFGGSENRQNLNSDITTRSTFAGHSSSLSTFTSSKLYGSIKPRGSPEDRYADWVIKYAKMHSNRYINSQLEEPLQPYVEIDPDLDNSTDVMLLGSSSDMLSQIADKVLKEFESAENDASLEHEGIKEETLPRPIAGGPLSVQSLSNPEISKSFETLHKPRLGKLIARESDSLTHEFKKTNVDRNEIPKVFLKNKKLNTDQNFEETVAKIRSREVVSKLSNLSSSTEVGILKSKNAEFINKFTHFTSSSHHHTESVENKLSEVERKKDQRIGTRKLSKIRSIKTSNDGKRVNKQTEDFDKEKLIAKVRNRSSFKDNPRDSNEKTIEPAVIMHRIGDMIKGNYQYQDQSATVIADRHSNDALFATDQNYIFLDANGRQHSQKKRMRSKANSHLGYFVNPGDYMKSDISNDSMLYSTSKEIKDVLSSKKHITAQAIHEKANILDDRLKSHRRSFRSISYDDPFHRNNDEKQAKIDKQIEKEFAEISNALKESSDADKSVAKLSAIRQADSSKNSMLRDFAVMLNTISKVDMLKTSARIADNTPPQETSGKGIEKLDHFRVTENDDHQSGRKRFSSNSRRLFSPGNRRQESRQISTAVTTEKTFRVIPHAPKIDGHLFFRSQNSPNYKTIGSVTMRDLTGKHARADNLIGVEETQTNINDIVKQIIKNDYKTSPFKLGKHRFSERRKIIGNAKNFHSTRIGKLKKKYRKEIKSLLGNGEKDDTQIMSPEEPAIVTTPEIDDGLKVTADFDNLFNAFNYGQGKLPSDEVPRVEGIQAITVVSTASSPIRINFSPNKYAMNVTVPTENLATTILMTPMKLATEMNVANGAALVRTQSTNAETLETELMILTQELTTVSPSSVQSSSSNLINVENKFSKSDNNEDDRFRPELTSSVYRVVEQRGKEDYAYRKRSDASLHEHNVIERSPINSESRTLIKNNIAPWLFINSSSRYKNIPSSPGKCFSGMSNDKILLGIETLELQKALDEVHKAYNESITQFDQCNEDLNANRITHLETGGKNYTTINDKVMVTSRITTSTHEDDNDNTEFMNILDKTSDNKEKGNEKKKEEDRTKFSTQQSTDLTEDLNFTAMFELEDTTQPESFSEKLTSELHGLETSDTSTITTKMSSSSLNLQAEKDHCNRTWKQGTPEGLLYPGKKGEPNVILIKTYTMPKDPSEILSNYKFPVGVKRVLLKRLNMTSSIQSPERMERNKPFLQYVNKSKINENEYENYLKIRHSDIRAPNLMANEFKKRQNNVATLNREYIRHPKFKLSESFATRDTLPFAEGASQFSPKNYNNDSNRQSNHIMDQLIYKQHNNDHKLNSLEEERSQYTSAENKNRNHDIEFFYDYDQDSNMNQQGSTEIKKPSQISDTELNSDDKKIIKDHVSCARKKRSSKRNVKTNNSFKRHENWIAKTDLGSLKNREITKCSKKFSDERGSVVVSRNAFSTARRVKANDIPENLSKRCNHKSAVSTQCPCHDGADIIWQGKMDLLKLKKHQNILKEYLDWCPNIDTTVLKIFSIFSTSKMSSTTESTLSQYQNSQNTPTMNILLIEESTDEPKIHQVTSKNDQIQKHLTSEEIIPKNNKNCSKELNIQTQNTVASNVDDKKILDNLIKTPSNETMIIISLVEKNEKNVSETPKHLIGGAIGELDHVRRKARDKKDRFIRSMGLLELREKRNEVGRHRRNTSFSCRQGKSSSSLKQRSSRRLMSVGQLSENKENEKQENNADEEEVMVQKNDALPKYENLMAKGDDVSNFDYPDNSYKKHETDKPKSNWDQLVDKIMVHNNNNNNYNNNNKTNDRSNNFSTKKRQSNSTQLKVIPSGTSSTAMEKLHFFDADKYIKAIAEKISRLSNVENIEQILTLKNQVNSINNSQYPTRILDEDENSSYNVGETVADLGQVQNKEEPEDTAAFAEDDKMVSSIEKSGAEDDNDELSSEYHFGKDAVDKVYNNLENSAFLMHDDKINTPSRPLVGNENTLEDSDYEIPYESEANLAHGSPISQSSFLGKLGSDFEISVSGRVHINGGPEDRPMSLSIDGINMNNVTSVGRNIQGNASLISFSPLGYNNKDGKRTNIYKKKDALFGDVSAAVLSNTTVFQPKQDFIVAEKTPNNMQDIPEEIGVMGMDKLNPEIYQSEMSGSPMSPRKTTYNILVKDHPWYEKQPIHRIRDFTDTNEPSELLSEHADHMDNDRTKSSGNFMADEPVFDFAKLELRPAKPSEENSYSRRRHIRHLRQERAMRRIIPEQSKKLISYLSTTHPSLDESINESVKLIDPIPEKLLNENQQSQIKTEWSITPSENVLGERPIAFITSDLRKIKPDKIELVKKVIDNVQDQPIGQIKEYSDTDEQSGQSQESFGNNLQLSKLQEIYDNLDASPLKQDEVVQKNPEDQQKSEYINSDHEQSNSSITALGMPKHIPKKVYQASTSLNKLYKTVSAPKHDSKIIESCYAKEPVVRILEIPRNMSVKKLNGIETVRPEKNNDGDQGSMSSFTKSKSTEEKQLPKKVQLSTDDLHPQSLNPSGTAGTKNDIIEQILTKGVKISSPGENPSNSPEQENNLGDSGEKAQGSENLQDARKIIELKNLMTMMDFVRKVEDLLPRYDEKSRIRESESKPELESSVQIQSILLVPENSSAIQVNGNELDEFKTTSERVVEIGEGVKHNREQRRHSKGKNPDFIILESPTRVESTLGKNVDDIFYSEGSISQLPEQAVNKSSIFENHGISENYKNNVDAKENSYELNRKKMKLQNTPKTNAFFHNGQKKMSDSLMDLEKNSLSDKSPHIGRNEQMDLSNVNNHHSLASQGTKDHLKGPSTLKRLHLSGNGVDEVSEVHSDGILNLMLENRLGRNNPILSRKKSGIDEGEGFELEDQKESPEIVVRTKSNIDRLNFYDINVPKANKIGKVFHDENGVNIIRNIEDTKRPVDLERKEHSRVVVTPKRDSQRARAARTPEMYAVGVSEIETTKFRDNRNKLTSVAKSQRSLKEKRRTQNLAPRKLIEKRKNKRRKHKKKKHRKKMEDQKKNKKNKWWPFKRNLLAFFEQDQESLKNSVPNLIFKTKTKRKTKRAKLKKGTSPLGGRKKRQIEAGGAQVRGGQDCMDRRHPSHVNSAKYQESAHCLRFSDLWYSVYQLETPIMEHTVYLQLFEKHTLPDGTTHWDDLTQGSMVRLGTFVRHQRDSVPTIAFTYSGSKIALDKQGHNLDPARDRLLVPSPVQSKKLGKYPDVKDGSGEYLIVQSNAINREGYECDKAGVGFATFVTQPNRCGQPQGTCLKNQPLAYWRHDVEAREAGRQGCYFLSNFGSVPNNPIKYNVSGSGSRQYLSLEYHSPHVSAIDIEVRADYNAIVRVGSCGRVTEVHVDSTAPEHTIVTIVISNMGLASSPYQSRISDCPTGLPVSWSKAKGAMQVIPPQHDQRVTLDLYGQLYVNSFHCSVEVVNHRGELVSMRRFRVQKMDRCFCVWHCLCACIGSVTGLGCQPMSPEHYHAAGFQGPVPVASMESSMMANVIKDVMTFSVLVILVLLVFGMLKWLIGLFVPIVSRCGLDILLEGTQMDGYFEPELQCRCIVTDIEGNVIHPDTGKKSVRICRRKTEFFLNLTFFLIYPIAACCKCAGRSFAARRQSRCQDESEICLLKDESSISCYPKLIRVNTYGDSRNSKMEAEDTRYVMNELKRSRDSLQGGLSRCNVSLRNRK